ncbi:unnamed protein product [Penicillium nalgiovense]|nr:unnamed protein product [Penicillium nalgiovense]
MPSEQGPARHNGVIGFQMAGVPLVAPVYKGGGSVWGVSVFGFVWGGGGWGGGGKISTSFFPPPPPPPPPGPPGNCWRPDGACPPASSHLNNQGPPARDHPPGGPRHRPFFPLQSLQYAFQKDRRDDR